MQRQKTPDRRHKLSIGLISKSKFTARLSEWMGDHDRIGGNFSGDPGGGLNWVNGARHSVSRVTFCSSSVTILFL